MAGPSPNLLLNAWGALSLYNGIDPQQATLFFEMVKADKFGLLTNDISKLKRELQDYYLREKLGNGCISKQMNLQTRYPVNMTPTKLIKPIALATSNQKYEKKVALINKLKPKDESYSEQRLNGIVDGCFQNNHANMAETKIKIILLPYTHLENSDINRVIRKINHFVVLVFKQRAKLSDSQYITLLKFFNIAVPKVNGLLDHNAFKQREFMH